MPNGTPTLEEFLHKEIILSLTGVTKRFADLDLFDEPRKLPEQYWPHIYLGMFACYLLRDRKARRKKNGVVWDIDNPKHVAHRLFNSARDVFDANAAQVHRLQREIQNSKISQKHRFHVLMYERAEIEMMEDELLDRLGSTRLRLPKEYKIADAQESYPELPLEEAIVRLDEERRNETYRNLTQLMGIYLARGNVTGALDIAGELDHFPAREQRELYGFSRAVTAYLREGGARTLSERAAGPGFLVNKYWYRQTFGTKKHPGKLYSLWMDSWRELTLGTAIGITVAKSGEYLAPAIYGAIHTIGEAGAGLINKVGG